MLTLYIKTGCVFCAMVLAKIDDLELDVEMKNVAEDGIAEELIELGGKKQEPFLIDDERGISMYEAADIVDYLEEHYSKKEDTEIEPPITI